MTHSYRQALLKADQVRMQLGLNMFQPINIFDACGDLGLTVRFVDVSMEGMYVKQNDGCHSTILLSNQRPLPRRCYTCAHELGHHVFGHGTKLDVMTDQASQSDPYDENELLVDSFAGALLMPVVGVQAAFTKRKWLEQNASPVDFYTICSNFGVGYQTLVYHCQTNKIITEAIASSLLKATPAKIFKSLFASGTNNSYFKIIDKHSKLSVIDLEVSNYIILPHDAEIEGDHLQRTQVTTAGVGYLAVKPGIVRAATQDGSISSFIRIQNFQYVGLAENRHLETLID